MAKGSGIIVTAFPKGVMEGGYISGTPKPGTLVMIKQNVAMINGRPTYKARDLPNGAQGPFAVLLEDDDQGFTRDTAYVSGTYCRVYYPAIGEDINAFVDQPGTGGAGGGIDDQVGQQLMCDSAGNLTPIGAAPAQAPFQCMENVVSPGNVLTPQLTWVKRVC